MCCFNPTYKMQVCGIYSWACTWVALCSLLINQLVMYCCLFVCLWACCESLTSPGKLGGTLIIKAWRASSWPHHVPSLSLLRLMGSWHMTNSGLLSYTQKQDTFPPFNGWANFTPSHSDKMKVYCQSCMWRRLCLEKKKSFDTCRIARHTDTGVCTHTHNSQGHTWTHKVCNLRSKMKKVNCRKFYLDM